MSHTDDDRFEGSNHTEEESTIIHPSSEQEYAVDMCTDLKQRIVSVTGGAGTGKTFVLGKVYVALRNEKVALCAPTGRAAKRIQELTGIKAVTVHKLLEFPMPSDDPVIIDTDPDDSDIIHGEERKPNEPRRNKFNPFEENVIIVDEASMVGPQLYRHLMDALPKKGVIRFFGDNNQLLPVEDGDPPFRTLLHRFPSIELTYNFRSGDAIVSNAYRVLRGLVPRNNDHFHVVYTDQPLLQLFKLVSAHPELGSDNNQIIMPTRKGSVGTGVVNPTIQLRLNRQKELLRIPRFDSHDKPLVVRAHDKFLWIKNDYELRLFNGEIGRITEIDPEEGTLWLNTNDRQHIEIPPRVRTYNAYAQAMTNYDPRKQIELGYAITTHKSQGSEFDTIVYCISRRAPFLLNRNNFYTAITRARNQVIVICDRHAMGQSLRRERRDK
jgi:exodeoxyribonuclease V alpha subunit